MNRRHRFIHTLSLENANPHLKMDMWRSDVWQNLIIYLGAKTFGSRRRKNSTTHTQNSLSSLLWVVLQYFNIYSFRTVIWYTAWVWQVWECVCILSRACVTVRCVWWAENAHRRPGFFGLWSVCVRCVSLRGGESESASQFWIVRRACWLTPICPVRVSHKVQSLLIVPDSRKMKVGGGGLIRFPVLFGAKVSSFLHTFCLLHRA